MLYFKTVCAAILLVLPFVPHTHHASLSRQEQEKYKNFLEGQGLYSADDDVDVLTVHNFKNELLNQSQAVLLEFYNSWCGFCQRFAPSWKALGTDTKSWRDLVRVAAYDCSDEANFPICREYEVMAYPTLRYFHEKFAETEGGSNKFGVSVLKGDDVNKQRSYLIETIINEQISGRGAIYPDLIPYNQSNLIKIFDSGRSKGGVNIKYAFLAIERFGDYYAPAVALDLHKTHDIVIKHSFNNNSDLLNYLKIDLNAKFPVLIVVDANSNQGDNNNNNNFQILSSQANINIDSRDALRKVIVDYLKSKQITIEVPQKSKEIFTGKWLEAEVPDMGELMRERARQALKERVKKMGDVVFQVDLETAVRYSLKHEISTVKIIQGEKLDALRAFVGLLKKYFPFGQNGLKFISDLNDYVLNNNEIQGENIGYLIMNAEKAESRVFSTPSDWLGCRGSSTHFRGYPCGLWKLFHYLTVNAADQNSLKNSPDPLEVLSPMHGYIKNFFGCADCAQHFQDMALKRDMKSVSSPDSAIVWLWMAHNQVNKRLSGDQTEDPEFPKVQFPIPARCPSCRFQNNTYNIPEVLRYIKHVYSNLNVRYIGADTSILHGVGLEAVPASGGETGIFKTLDSSMCFVLYVASFLLLAVLIRMFLKRGYRKKPYVHDLLGKV